GLDDHSVDLVTVAAAAHWFDLEAFYEEVRRVARPGAVVALWTYRPHVRVHPAVEAIVDELAEERLASFWAAPIPRYVAPGYQTLPFPFEELPVPELACRVRWPLEGLLAHLRTWSGVQTAWRATGRDLVDEVAPALAEAWGDPEQALEVRFPLHVRLGRR
ncbi:MAG: methyltransferase domain-containing protein, partial [Pseudomonadota bacterium]